MYDILKLTKRKMKISSGLVQASSAPYASDIPFRSYEVINHKKGETLKCEFTMNSTLRQARVTVVERTEVPNKK